MGSVSVGTVSIFVCLHVGRGCVYSFACMRVGTFACVYGCLFVYIYVSGRALDSTSLIISVDPHPTTMPCRWRMPPVRWWFSRAGAGCSGERRPTFGGRLAGPGPTGLAGPRLGVGGLWVSGPRARSALVWSTAGGACGLAATATLGCLHCGCWRSHLRALLCPFSGWRPRLSLRWFSWGSRVLGGPGCFGARIFSMPASCLAGWGLLFSHTHY